MPRSEPRYDLLRKRLDLFSRALRGVEDGDVRSLHRARVASRRLRELVPVLQLDDDTAVKLAKRLRKVTIRLGRVRELDVLRQLVDDLERTHPRRAIDLVRSAIDRERRDHRAALAGGKALAGMHRLAAKLRDVLDSRLESDRVPRDAGAPARGWTWALDARLARRAAKLRAAIGEAGTVYNPERLHDVRIAMKKLRYALELAADARGLKTTSELAVLRRGQDLLGRLHDLQMLDARARQVRDVAPDRAAAHDLDCFVSDLEADCRRLHAEYVGERGALTAICDRLLSARHGALRPARARRTA